MTQLSNQNEMPETGEKPVVMHRKNHCEWLVTMPIDEWIELYREWESGQRLKEGD